MDSELVRMIEEEGTTVSIARVTAIGVGGAETLSAPVVVPAHVEHKREHWPNGAAGGAAVGTGRKTRTEVTIAPEHLAAYAPALGELKEDDRFWVDGTSSADATFSRRPDRFFKAKDPDTGAVSHYEVTL